MNAKPRADSCTAGTLRNTGLVMVLMGTMAVVGWGPAVWSQPHLEDDEQARALIDKIRQAIEDDDYQALRDAAQESRRLGESIGSFTLLVVGEDLLSEATRLNNEFRRLRPMLNRIDEDPGSAPANLRLGQFYAMTKGDWQRGLPMLALSDGPLALLAEQELAQPADVGAFLALADGWWQAAESERGPQRFPMRERAIVWYERAFNDIQDEADRQRVAERLLVHNLELFADTLSVPASTFYLVQHLDVRELDIALGIDVKAVSGPTRPNLVHHRTHFLIDNRSSRRSVDEADVRLALRFLLRDRTGHVNVRRVERGLGIARPGEESIAIRMGPAASVARRNDGTDIPHNIFAEVKVADVVVRRVFLQPPGEWPWWLDDKLVE